MTTDPSPRRVWPHLASRTVRMRSDLPTAVLDVLIGAASFTSMLVLRFDGAVPGGFWLSFRSFLPVALVLVVVCNWGWGLYGHLWRHASIFEARRLVFSGLTLTAVLLVLDLAWKWMPTSVIVTGAVCTTFLSALVRFQARLFSFRRAREQGGLQVVLVGAGTTAARLIAEMRDRANSGFLPVAVVDDDHHLQGRFVAGVEVAGTIDDLPEVVAATGAHLVVLAMSDPTADVVRRCTEAAEAAGVPLKILPAYSTAIHANTSLRDLRDVRIEDLLGRDQIVTDLAAVRAMLAGRRVLITGAGGSIGSEIARQVAACGPEVLVVLDHDETHLHDVAATIERPVVQSLTDVRDLRQMQVVFQRHRPQVVFHAAAHKHVPLLEAHPVEAVRTNVIGTANLLACAEQCGVERLVFISTDKAVYPSSVMGASKRLGEQLIIARAPEPVAYCAVRFGNVLGSRGSVVPTFMRQIEAGGPVTVTDRRMTRFFMSIEEAVQLVLQAAALADANTGGEVFMLDMGEPVSIYDLAERMIRLSGRRPGVDIEIQITGIRPGEKLVEELRALDEEQTPTAHPSISRVSTAAIPAPLLEAGLEELVRRAEALDEPGCADTLRALASDPGCAETPPALTSDPVGSET